LARLGGKATRGKVSRRKLAAIRRNLKKARGTRQLNRLRQMTETAYRTLQSYREREWAMIEAAAVNQAELMRLEPMVRKDPALSKLLDWMRSRQKDKEREPQERIDSGH
jgi:hypothetical protein